MSSKRTRLALLALVCAAQGVLAGPTTLREWGTYERPFRADSPWNSRPVEPVLGDAEVPTSYYVPAVEQGAYSTGVFRADPKDTPMKVRGLPGRPGIWDPDSESVRPFITIPRWPAGTLPATGTDGHADIVDSVTGVIHSFWQLRKVGDEWRAEQYAWTPLDGRGWGDPAHYFQGSRAAGVPTSGGLIRKHEVRDGDTLYRHALALSLTFNGLSAKPTYQYPATSSDNDAAQRNTGRIPMGSLLMLPPGFAASNIRHPDLRKVVETLKVYGAYVVDRNEGTPFNIYVENGANFALHRLPDGRNGWNNEVAADLDRIRKALRPVVSAKAWLDGNGMPVTERPHLNLLSLRGPWMKLEGRLKGEFDTLRQAVVFPENAGAITLASESDNKFARLLWAKPEPGQRLRLSVKGSEGATVRIRARACPGADEATRLDTGDVKAGTQREFTWPDKVCQRQIVLKNGDGEGETWVGAEVIAVVTTAQP